LDAGSGRLEPTRKEYHTGPRAAGRETAAQQSVFTEKTGGIGVRLHRKKLVWREGDA
jgi:hypothetical protein